MFVLCAASSDSFGDGDSKPNINEDRKRSLRVESLYIEAVKFGRAGDFERSLQAFRQVLMEDAGCIEVYCDIAIAHKNMRDYAAASKAVESYISLKPSHSLGWQILGDIHLQQGDFVGAIRDFSQAIKLEKANSDHHLNRAAAYLQVFENEKAIADLQQALKLNPRSDAAQTMLSVANLRNGTIDAAQAEALKALSMNNGCSTAWAISGICKYANGERDGGDANLKKSVSLNPAAEPELCSEMKRLIALLISSDRTIESIRLSRAYVERYPSDADGWRLFGRSNARGGQFLDAVAAYSEAVKADPKFVATYINRAICLIHLNRLEDALADCRTVQRLDKACVQVHMYTSHILMRQKRFEEAISEANMVLDHDPNNTYALANRGICERRLGRSELAQADFVKCLKNSPLMSDYIERELKRIE